MLPPNLMGEMNGKINGMKCTIDGVGRMVIPKSIREAAGLRPGMALDVCWNDGRIEIEVAPLAVRLVRHGRLLVAAPETDVVPLNSDLVEETRASLRATRATAE